MTTNACPRLRVAFNVHVAFTGHATLRLAETGVDGGRCAHRNGG